MYVDPTLTREDFDKLDHALCDLRRIQRDCADADSLHTVSRALSGVIDQFETALADAFDQNRAGLNKLLDHYAQVAQDQRIHHSRWSITEVANLHEPHPYDGARCVVYTTHWGAGEVSQEIRGDTWLDLWRAADACINQSGDRHHYFIERFEPIPDSDFELNLVTGS